METRPRRSHHRPLQGKLDTRSLPSPKQFHLRLQPRCNQVQAASGRPCWSATSRGFTTPRVGVICHLLVGFLFGFPCFWAFSCSRAGVSRCLCAVCAWACSCGCVCGCLCSVPGPSWSLLRFCVACAVAVAPFGAGPVGVCWLASCPGRFSGPVSCGFFSGISQDTWGIGRVRDSSASASEVLKAESSANLSCEG